MPRLPDVLRAVPLPLVARLAAILIALCAAVAIQRDRMPIAPYASWAPEAATGRQQQRLATATRSMVATPNPHATEAGLAMLRAGGSAADAAIAAQMVLTLVEPQATGIGGGGFALYWDGARRALASFDGRETAPAAARPDRFLENGRPLPFPLLVHSGLSVGTPGVVRLLETLHRRFGRLPWAQLMEPAIQLADAGFKVSPRLALLLVGLGPSGFDPVARAYFFDPSGKPWPIGNTLRNAEFAATLRRIASEGADAFYRGAIAEGMVAAVAAAPNRAGDLSLADLAGYAVRERDPICTGYRGLRVCGMGPPSSGAIAVGQTLRLVEPFDLGRGPGAAMNHQAMHLLAEAEKLAFADRNFHVGDPDVVPVPEGLLDADYLDARRRLINSRAGMPRPFPGTPPALRRADLGADDTHEAAGTSHLSVVDPAGNAIALTTSVEAAFGARIMTGGFLLNNQLTDFAPRPRDGSGRPLANAIAPGKRPRSSMAPTIVLDAQDRLAYVLGSTGGSGIILYTAQALVALIDWGLDAQAAAGLSRFGSRGGDVDIELDDRAVWHALKLRPYGHRITVGPMTSGTQIIAVTGGRLEGGADPRKEGTARGD